ncbi:helix-turn-helix transcriptional regulator [Paenibacillus sp. UNC451MF]|uniref:helix-turn-helix transcriptional regulator n=1 Tax=Paenibacillus sp. UNC451MF TaxID=1449063 RepID=UPI00048C9F76|nr:helix-turn-helix domain-containing protein [Paenibacillus sp. UNC451MF]
MTKKSYFLKLLAFNIALVIISVSFLGYIAYWKTSGVLNERIHTVNTEMLIQTQLQLENSLQSIESAIVQLSLSPIFTKILEDDLNIISYDNYLKVRNMVLEISSLYLHDSIINNIEIINLEKGWVLRNGGVLAITEVYNDEEIEKFRQSGTGSSWSKLNADYFQYTLKVPFASFQQFQGIIRTKLSSHEINQELMANKELGEITLIDANGQMIRSFTQYKLRDDNVNEIVDQIHSRTSQAPQGTFLAKLGDADYSIIYMQSAKYKWTYVSVVSTLEARRDSRFIGLFIFITGIFVVSVFFVLSLFGTRRLYSPIKRLYQLVSLYSNEKSPLQSNELDFMNNKLLLFFQDSKKLQGQLEIQTQQLNDFFAFKLFQGEVKQREIDKNWSNQVHWCQFGVLTVQIDTIEGTVYKDSDKDLLLFAVKNMGTEIAGELLVLNPVIMHNIAVVLMGVNHRSAGAFKEEIYLLSRSIQQAIKQYLRLQISIGISAPFTKLVQAGVAFHEAADALKSRITHGREAILFASEVDVADAVKVKYPTHIVKELTDAVKFGDTDQSKRSLNSFTKEIFSGQYDYRNCSMFVFLLLMDLIKISNHSDERFLKLFREKPIFDQLDLLLQTSAQETEEWIHSQVVEPIIEEILARNETQQRNITKMLIQYIQDEYDTELTLEGCASRLHYNPNYLGQIFKRETGSTFSDYLSQYRLILSKKLLVETNDQVQEIAEKLRFSNSQNFIRYFRKMEGMTPKQYRDYEAKRGSLSR